MCLLAMPGFSVSNATAQIDITNPTIIGVLDPAINPRFLLPPYLFRDPTLYQAEARADGLPTANALGGFSGSGYVEMTEGDEISFDVTVPTGKRGLQQLEIRYSFPSGISATDVQFFRNNSRVRPSITVEPNGVGNWFTASQITNLREGDNSIKVVIPGPASTRKVLLLDSLRVSQTPPDAERFLEYPKRVNEKFFAGTEANANAYYRTIDPIPKRLTFDDFLIANSLPTWTDNAGRQAVIDLLKADPDGGHAVYQNVADLNFGRDMYVKKHADGSVMSFVQNYPTLQDAIDGENLIATVAMEYRAPDDDPSGTKFTVFYVYDNTGKRVNKIDLDGRGEKFVPALCNSCHGGKPKAHRTSLPLFGFGGSLIPGTPIYQDKGYTDAKWIPWDLDNLLFSASNTRADQALQLRKLNRLTLCTKATSAVFGMVRDWYGASGGTCDSFNPTTEFDGDAHVPFGWDQEEAHRTLYRKVVAPSCRTCHAQRATVSLTGGAKESSLDLTSFDDFMQYRNIIKTMVYDEGSMPAAKVTYERFWRSTQPAILDNVLFDGKAYQNPPSTEYFPRGGLGPQRIPGHPVPKLATVNGKLRYRPGESITLNSLGSLFNEKVISGTLNYSNPAWSVKDGGSYKALAAGGRITSITPSSVTHDVRGVGIDDFSSNIRVGVRNRFTVPWAYLDYGQLYRDPNKERVVFSDDDPATTDVWDLLLESRDNTAKSFKVNCLFCHSTETGIGEARSIFHLKDPSFANIGVLFGSELAEKRFAYNQVVSRIDCRDPQESLILIKPGDQRRHFGGSFTGLRSGNDDYQLILEWIIDGAPFDAARSYKAPGAACNDDTDGDGILDYDDNCPTVANASGADNQLDFDQDGIGDACELDRDGDGVKDDKDNCPYDANGAQVDADLDGMGDICDVDDDNDGVYNKNDNCIAVPNPSQTDTDDDGVGDACEDTGGGGSDARIVTTPDRSALPDYGWVVFGDGTKQWISIACRTQLDASGLTTDLEPWSQIDSYPDRTPVSCDAIASSDTPPDTPPDTPTSTRIVTTPDRSEMPDYGWVVFGDNTKQWIDATCRGQLQTDGLTTTLESWTQISSYSDRAALPCSEIPTGSDDPSLAIYTTPDRQADGEYAWVILPGNTKQWIPGACRSQLEANGATVTIKPWTEISAVPDDAEYRSCAELL